MDEDYHPQIIAAAVAAAVPVAAVMQSAPLGDFGRCVHSASQNVDILLKLGDSRQAG